MGKSILLTNLLNETEYTRSLVLKTDIQQFDLKVYRIKDVCDEINILTGSNLVSDNYLSDEDLAFKFMLDLNDDDGFKSFDDFMYLSKTINELQEIYSPNAISILEKHKEEVGVSKILKALDIIKTKGYKTSTQYVIDTLENYNCSFKFDLIKTFSFEFQSRLNKALIEKVSNEREFIDKDYFNNLYKVNNIEPCYGEESEVDKILGEILEGTKKGKKLDESVILLAKPDQYIYSLLRFSRKFQIPMTFGTGLPINLSNSYKLFTLLNELEFSFSFDVNGYKKLFNLNVFDLKIKSIENIDNTTLINFAKTYLPEVLGRMKISFNKVENKEKFDNFFVKSECWKIVLNEIFSFKYTNYKDLDCAEIIKEITCDFIFNDEYGISLGKTNFFTTHCNAYVIDKKENENEYDKYYYELINNINIFSKEYIQKRINIMEQFLNNIGFDSIKDLDKKNKIANIVTSYFETIGRAKINSKIFHEGMLHIDTINKGFSIIKDNTYILGLNSQNFPSKTRENFLLPDSLLKELSEGKDESNIKFSFTRLEQEKNMFGVLLSSLAKYNSTINLSYPFYNVIAVKEINPSSLIFDLASKGNGVESFEELKNKKDCQTYFSGALSPIKKYGEYFCNEGRTLNYKSSLVLTPNSNDLLTKPKQISPSGIELFLECPRKFFVSKYLKVEDESDYDSSDTFPNNHFGSLIHFLLKDFLLNKSSFKTIDVLLNKGRDLFDTYVSLNIPEVDPFEIKRDFLTCLTNGYLFLIDKEPFQLNGEVFLEKEVSQDMLKDNLIVKGTFDAMVKDKDGKIYLLDYKTGGSISKDSKDWDSLIQLNIYKYLISKQYKNQINIGSVQYFFLRLNEFVEVPFSPDDFSKVEEVIKKIGDCFKEKKFICMPNKDKSCKYCVVKNVCKKAITD